MKWSSLRRRSGYLAVLLLVTLGVTACSSGPDSQDNTLAESQIGSPSTGLDTVSPVVTIKVPSSESSVPISSSNTTTTVSGLVSDTSTITQVSWTNDRSGNGSADNFSNTGWSITNVPLFSGANKITVTARDAAGNAGTDTLTINFTQTAGCGTSCANNVALVVSWTPNPASDNVLSYLVYAGADPNSATQLMSDLSVFGGVDPNAPVVTYNAGIDLGLKPGDPICFKLVARNSAGPSGFSGAACTNI